MAMAIVMGPGGDHPTDDQVANPVALRFDVTAVGRDACCDRVVSERTGTHGTGRARREKIRLGADRR